MEACCSCGGPIFDDEDDTPGGIPCSGTCRHRMCCGWCVVTTDSRGPRCRHCLGPSTPDGEAQQEKVVLSQPCLFQEEEMNQIEKDVMATVFEPKLQIQSQMYHCYICHKFTKFQLKCKACEWLTCPMCKECFDEFHGSCKQPPNGDEVIPDLETESDEDSDKEEEYLRRIELRRMINLRNQRRSGSASSSWRPPPGPPDHWINKCYKCKRVTRDQSALCSFCERPCCHDCMKLTVCCQRWKCKQCTCFCKRDKLRAMRAKRERARIIG